VTWFEGSVRSHILTGFPATLQLLRCGLRGHDRLRRRSPMMGPADRSVKPAGPFEGDPTDSRRARRPSPRDRARRRMVWGHRGPVNRPFGWRIGRPKREPGRRPDAALSWHGERWARLGGGWEGRLPVPHLPGCMADPATAPREPAAMPDRTSPTCRAFAWRQHGRESGRERTPSCDSRGRCCQSASSSTGFSHLPTGVVIRPLAPVEKRRPGAD